MERSIRISDAVYKQIKTCAKEEKRTLKMLLEIAVAQYLQKKILER
jgi:predicted transcriptional regulator